MSNKPKKIPFARLRGLRAERDLSQDDMAKLLGISKVAYLHKENGKSDFKASEMRIIKNFFKVSADEIFFS